MIKQLLIMITLLLLGHCTLLAQQWTDSLHVRVSGDEIKVVNGKSVLEFDIEIYRPNDNWLEGDEFLGASSFVFGDKLDELYDSPILLSTTHSYLIGGTTKLSMSTSFVDHRVVIDIEKKSDNDLLTSFPIPPRTWIQLCRVRLILKDPTVAALGIKWHSQTAMATENFSPIILTTLGEIDEPSDKFIRFITPSRGDTLLQACEGNNVSLVAKAISTGGGTVTYNWRDSVKTKPASTLVQGGRQTHPIRGYEYEIFNGGDSLVIYNAPASIDTALFRCKAQDLNLGSTELVNAVTAKFELRLRDKLPVALTSSDFSGRLLKSGDSVFMCPGGSATVNAAFFYSGSKKEIVDEHDSIYVVYEGWLDKAEFVSDTLRIDAKLNSLRQSARDKIFYFQFTLNAPGRYYVKEAWTRYGCTEEIVSKYDTVIVKESKVVNVDMGDEVVIVVGTDSVVRPPALETIVDCSTDMVNVNTSVGYLSECTYTAMAVGHDTIIYTYKTVEGCNVTSNQYINVVDKHYLTLNVMLEGAYIAARDSMKCIFKDNFPGAVNEYESPYSDKLKTPKPFLNFGRQVTDWIFVELWDYPPYGMNSGDTRRGELKASTSALLLSDGTVCGVDGKKYLSFTGLDKSAYYILIKHRNHLSILSSGLVSFTTTEPVSTILWDFSHVAGNAFGGVDALKLTSGRYLMYAGDINASGRIDIKDVNSITLKLKTQGYLNEDVNFSNRIDIADKSLGISNIGEIKKY